LYQNRLTELPESFSELASLQRLNLSWNQFRSFPAQVSRLPRLDWFAYFYNEDCERPALDTVQTCLWERPFTSEDHLQTDEFQFEPAS
ncbi:MAG: hypothetical protein O3B72_11120, partial [Proteobacteria bacterium]|nr:hypothetical protein [Pseudomonadota bacterium]